MSLENKFNKIISSKKVIEDLGPDIAYRLMVINDQLQELDEQIIKKNVKKDVSSMEVIEKIKGLLDQGLLKKYSNIDPTYWQSSGC